MCNPTVDPATNKLVGYTFDTAGNTTLDAENRTFIYDAENKQTEVKDANNVSIGKYFYDGDGKRVKKISGSEVTIFIYDAAGKLVAEYANQTTQTQTVSYLTSDHLGSPRINTDQNGAVTARHDYQPFGEEITRASYGADTNRKQFTGYERDKEANLDFAQNRYHDYNHGRFTSPDPLMASARRANPQTFNRYSYVANNPLNLIDPLGLAPCPPNQTCYTVEGDAPGIERYMDNGEEIIDGDTGQTAADVPPPLTTAPPSSLQPTDDGGFWRQMQQSATNPCNAVNLLGYIRPITRAIERDVVGQDIMPDSVNIGASWLGGNATLSNERTGNVVFSGGANIDPKLMFVDIPSAIAKGTNISPSFSLTGSKILKRGNLTERQRVDVIEGVSASFSGGYKIVGGIDISNPTNSRERTYSVQAGVGQGLNINTGGISYGKKLFKGCLGW